MGFSTCHAAPKPKSGARLTAYEYCEHGTMAQPNTDFRITLDKGEQTCLISIFSHESMNYHVYRADASLMDSICLVIREKKMHKYKAHYKPCFEVLDGNTWHYEASFSDGTLLTSHGHEAGPRDKGFRTIELMVKNWTKNSKLIEQRTERDCSDAPSL